MLGKNFANGTYALNEAWYENWLLIEEFPPYEIAIANGEEMWNIPFANGKTYADCFGEPGVQHHYPRWDKEQGQVVTLALAINQCREAHGEEPLKYKKGPIVDLLAYMAYESRGQIINVVVPEDDPGALEAYKKGREFYFTRRGQLNFALRALPFQHGGAYASDRTPKPGAGSGDRLAGLPVEVGRDRHPAPPLHRLQQAGSRQAVRGSGRGIPEPGILPYPHEQRLAPERAGSTEVRQA